MGRSHVKPIQQPDKITCGPAALKHALAIFGRQKSLESLMQQCKTNRNGTTTQNMIDAANKLGFYVLAVQYATLHHLSSALRHSPNKIRAVLVSYLYDLDKNDHPHPESGHWAVVSSFSASKSRIYLLDSDRAWIKSYAWADFRRRWIDYDFRRRKVGRRGNHFRLVRKWQRQLLLIMAKDRKQLPTFRIASSQLFPPKR